MRALLICPVIPSETGNGLSMRAGLWLEALSRRFDTDVAVAQLFPAHATAAAFTTAHASSVTMLGGTLGSDPSLPRPVPALDDASAAALGALIAQADVVVVFRLYLAGLAAPATELGVPVVVDLDDADWVREERLGQPAEADAYRRYAAAVLGTATVATMASPADAADGPSVHPRPQWRHVPNGVRPAAAAAQAERDIDLLFVATLGYEPNAHGAVWLVREVLPRLPGVTVALVGATPPPAVRALAGPGVIVAGDVDEVGSWYARARACVVPIHAGAGTRTKIPEAWAHRRPVVSTSIGAEGLPTDVGVLVADDPDAFAAACARVLADPALADTLASDGLQRWLESHALEPAITRADDAVDAALAIAGRTPPARVRP